MRIRRILVGVDFSELSDTALEHAIRVARRTEAKIVLVHACQTANYHYVASMTPQNVIEQIGHEMHSKSRLRLDALCERGSHLGVSMSSVLLDEDPARALSAEAVRQHADLVVVGTHGRTGFGRVLLGSVAERTVRLCETTVMVTRRRQHEERGFRRILVPTDFSAAAEAAIRAALALLDHGGSIDLVHCWRLPSSLDPCWVPAAGDYPVDLHGKIASEAAAMGEALVERYRDQCDSITFAQVEEAPVPGIHRCMQAESYDLVVMGSRGLRGLRRLLLGSVAEATVRHAPCSVLVAHAAHDDAGQGTS